MSDDLPKIDFRKAMEQNAIAASQWFAAYERAAEEACDLRERVAELEAALRGLLEPFDDDPCRYDHHGYCQEHFVEPGDRCCVKLARDALKDRNETEPEREPDNRTDNLDNRLDGEREET